MAGGMGMTLEQLEWFAWKLADLEVKYRRLAQQDHRATVQTVAGEWLKEQIGVELASRANRNLEDRGSVGRSSWPHAAHPWPNVVLAP
jgi:hypothetical protein